MPRYLIEVRVDTYLRYIAEAVDEDEARLRGRVDWENGVEPELIIDVEQVEDDAPEGNV